MCGEGEGLGYCAEMSVVSIKHALSQGTSPCHSVSSMKTHASPLGAS